MHDAALVIFDCDGVLVDSERISNGVLRDMLVEMGIPISFDDTVQRFMGASMLVCMQRIARLRGRPPPADFMQQFARRTKVAFSSSLTVVPGVVDVLMSLGMPFCVASNGNHAKVNFTLGHTGLLPRFAGRIFTAEDVVHPKPAPDLFLHAARSLNAEAAQVVVVEDTPTGIAAAKAAGMRAIGFAAMTPAAMLREAGADVVAVNMPEVRHMLAAR